jgi:hypothetical protein
VSETYARREIAEMNGDERVAYLDPLADGVDDVRHELVHLLQRLEREERGVVVVPAELAHNEQRPPEQVPAL